MIREYQAVKMLRFDTRDKKPKLYALLAEAVAVVVLLAVLVLKDADRYAAAISVILTLFFFSAVVQLFIAFVRQVQYNPYSYNTIFYLGFALFFLSVTILLLIFTTRIMRQPEINWHVELFSLLTGSAKLFILLTFPFILVFSIGLCISNISLLRHEGRKMKNLLGILLSFLLVGGQLLIFFSDYYYSGSRWQVMIHDLIVNIFAAVYLYFECMILGVMTADAMTARYEPEPNKDYIIILGCMIRKDGTPTPLLKSRIDRALDFAEKQQQMTGKEAVFVTSGGKGSDENISESACMKRYLMEKGIPKDRIIEEDKSRNTFENMTFSKELINGGDPGVKVAFSTTNYHVFRSGIYARRVKMRAVGMGAPTKWYYWPNAAIREFMGILKYHRLKQILIFSGLVLAYVFLTIMYYQ